jgi:hypothetical protein
MNVAMTRGKLRLVAVAVALTSTVAVAVAAAAPGGPQDRWSFAPEAPAHLRLPGESADVHFWLSCILVHCRPSARAYVRALGSGSFTSVRVVTQHNGSDVVHVPPAIANAPRGFEYYVAAHDSTSHQQARYPIGGAVAPKRSFLLSHPIVVDLGPPTRAAGPPHRRVVSVAWGARPDQVGLKSEESGEVGVAAFDVTSSGAVWLLDQVKHRALSFTDGHETRALPLAIGLSAGWLAAGATGELYVLDNGTSVLHEFSRTGRTMAAFHVPDELAGGVRALGSTVYVDLEPSGQWAPVIRNGAVLDRRAAIRGVLSGEPLADGRQVAVWARADVRVALLSNTGLVERSWRLVGATANGAVLELAQPLGKRLVVVLAQSNRYQVVVLEGHRVVERFAVPQQEWTNPAAGTFRLVGSSLYHLGSTSRGVFVDRYDLTR